MKVFAHGKRGIIYLTKINGIPVCVKKKNPKSEAEGNLENEYNVLKLLNMEGLNVPRVIKYDNGVYYYFIPGKLLKDYVNSADREELLWIIKESADLCYKLDVLGINKEEMHHPWKHIVINNSNGFYKKGIYFVDFERARKSHKVKNLTQFLQFLSTGMHELLMRKKIFYDKDKLRKFSKEYKRNKKNYRKIIDYLTMSTFEQKVLYEVSNIPKGSTLSYKEVAEKIGHPRAYRAVGNVLNRNKFFPYVPCHRVIKSNGDIGGFSRGKDEKRYLLEKESSRF